MIKPIALGLAVGILLDAFLVRMTLVPALMTLFGRAAWWMPAWLDRLLPHADVEGEKLGEHRQAVDWVATQEDAISADGLIFGSPAAPVGPITASVPAGSLLVLTGDRSRRSLLTATLGGRLDPVAGRLQVEGHPLPSESSRVRRLVAMADVSQPAPDITVGRLLDEHIRLTSSRRGSARLVHHWVQNIDSALSSIGVAGRRVAVSTPMVSLTPLETATVLFAAALAEGTPVVSITQADDFAAADRLLATVTAMAPPHVTIIVGAVGPYSSDRGAGRPVITIDVDAVDRREVLQ